MTVDLRLLTGVQGELDEVQISQLKQEIKISLWVTIHARYRSERWP